jgi:hypothetical protein
MTITYSAHRDRGALHDRFRATLARAAEHRGQRPDFIALPSGRHEIGWVLYERACMRAEVNQARAERGKPPADVDVIERAENHAAGHVDYASKFALYCAEIVLDMPPWISPPSCGDPATGT